jgi:hypothetical protein
VTDNKSVIDDRTEVDDRVEVAISAILGRALREGKTYADLESDTGVKASTLKAYNGKHRHPSLAAGLMIAAGIGDWAVNKLVNIIRYQAQPLDEADGLQPMQIVADALQHLGVIGQAAADNRIDHTERPRTTEAADQLIATIVPLSSAGWGA